MASKNIGSSSRDSEASSKEASSSNCGGELFLGLYSQADDEIKTKKRLKRKQQMEGSMDSSDRIE